jgi:hypothetical protein
LNTADVTDGRYVRNSTRPIDLLVGDERTASFKAIGKRSAKSYVPEVAEAIVQQIGDVTDSIILPLFDELRPFLVHNEAMRELMEALNDPAARADPIQSKCKSLLFDGSGDRIVFEEHTARLNKRKEELIDHGKQVPPHLEQQITYCESVAKALDIHEDRLKLNRAFKLFSIDASGFQGRDKAIVEKDIKRLRALAKSIFDTVATQAFQVGYLMAALTAIERMCPAGTAHVERSKSVQFVSRLFVNGLNSLFSVSSTKHKSLAGYVAEPRAGVFDGGSEGFRGLLQAGNIRELNEKQWEFFRFVVLEVLHSKRAFDNVKNLLEDEQWADQIALYEKALPDLLKDLDLLRKKYIDSAVRTAISSDDFKRRCLQAEAEAIAAGKGEKEAKAVVEALIASMRHEVEKACKQQLAASLGKLEARDDQLRRFSVLDAGASLPAAPDAEDEESLTDSIIADELLNGDALNDELGQGEPPPSAAKGS